MTRLALTAAVLLALALAPLEWFASGGGGAGVDAPRVVVGSKKFTESIVLGDIVRLAASDAGAKAEHFKELGGTKVVFEALRGGEIDAYVEYTGTIVEEILGGEEGEEISSLAPEERLAALRGALAERGVAMSEPIGFNNTYVLAMRPERAAELGVRTISDLRDHPELRFGFANEFMGRKDGWPSVQQRYRLPQKNVTGMDHDLAYRELARGGVDVVDAYATDAQIAQYGLVLLEDDLHHFPRYDAVLVYRDDLNERAPEVVESINRLEGAIDEPSMAGMNARVVQDRAPASLVAAEYLRESFEVDAEAQVDGVWSRVLTRTAEHLNLVRRSLLPAILIAVPLGIAAAKRPTLGQAILAVVGVIQTVPSLALLVGLMPLVALVGWTSVGPSSATAVIALMLYSLLPIVRNTHAGLTGIAEAHREAAAALGLPAGFRLVNIELPLAASSILAGIKTAAVLNVGFATLGALIGAGGYGQPILTGIRLNDTALILEGAIPSALLALAVQGLFELSERYIVPKGLRLKPAE